MKQLLLFVALILITVIFMGCTSNSAEQLPATKPTPNAKETIGYTGHSTVYYIHDEKRGVGIWIAQNNQWTNVADGVAVLPDHEYKNEH